MLGERGAVGGGERRLSEEEEEEGAGRGGGGLEGAMRESHMPSLQETV
jgi:hypothetical protein